MLPCIASAANRYYLPPAGGGPTYTPFYANTWDAGTNGSAPPNFNRVGDTQASTDIAGPFGESRTIKCVTGQAGGGLGGEDTYYGGDFPAGDFTVSAGESVWIAIQYYIPTAFCAGFGSSQGDGYGLTKWFRLERLATAGGAETGNRITIQAQNFISQACSSTGPAFWGCSCEGFTAGSGALPGFHYYDADFGATAPTDRRMPRQQWGQQQYKLTFGTTSAASTLEMWNNGTYLGVCTRDAAFLTASTNHFRPYIGNYWNGGPPNASRPQSFYVSNAIMTKETPNTLDAGGRAYISPTHGAADFA